MLAEEAGFERPYRIQSLLGRSSWSADALHDFVRCYVIEALGDADGVLIVDKTGVNPPAILTLFGADRLPKLTP